MLAACTIPVVFDESDNSANYGQAYESVKRGLVILPEERDDSVAVDCA